MTIALGFMGGADTVTGSQHIIDVNGKRIMRDCGLFQGRRKESREFNETFLHDVADIDAMLLSHAHIDHCGNIPSLMHYGFEAPIHATTATMKIAGIMLRDAAHIQEQDAAYLNQKTNRKDKEPVEPLYTTEDAEEAYKLFRGHHYHEPLELIPGVVAEDFEAGHILGSAVTRFTVQDGTRTHRIGYAVDLGRKNLPLIRDPELLEDIDTLVIESTYGNRMHGPAIDAEKQLEKVINETYARGGKVIIPSFALERSQEILYHLSSLIIQKRIPEHPVYLDSPMATNVTRVFNLSGDYMDDEFNELKEEMRCLLCPPWVHFTSSVAESKEVTAARGPFIVIAASGMCEHGRILHHLKHGIEDPDNTVVIVGYQAEHTLGRRLVEQQEEVRIFGDTFERRAPVVQLDAFSAHADRQELLDYIRAVDADDIYLVHGEQVQREALAGAIEAERLGRVHLPKRGDWVEL